MFACHHMLTHALAGSGAFFAFGLAGGMHCAGMCGPLACLLGRPEERPLARLGLYHSGRLLAYASIGALAAAAGRPLVPLLSWPVVAAVAALPLLAYAFWPRSWAPAFLGAWHNAAALRLGGLDPTLRALGLGLLTPGLPCGLLYAAAGAAITAPSWAVGAGWMASFGAGTLPILALGQGGFSWLAGRGPGFIPFLRRASAALAAITILALSFLG
jgi:sulfite exporter TauE/SafE